MYYNMRFSDATRALVEKDAHTHAISKEAVGPEWTDILMKLDALSMNAHFLQDKAGTMNI